MQARGQQPGVPVFHVSQFVNESGRSTTVGGDRRMTVTATEPAAPLAGVWGGPPAGRHDGRDAVITLTDALREREES